LVEDRFFTGNFQGQVSLAKGNGGKVGVMSENEPNLGSEESNQHNDFAAQMPPADEVGESVTPVTSSTVSGDTTPVPPTPPAAPTTWITPMPPAASPGPTSSPWDRAQAAASQESQGVQGSSPQAQGSALPQLNQPSLTLPPTTHPYGQQPWANPQVPFGAPVPPSTPESGARAANMPWRRAAVAVVAAAAIALTAGGVGGFVGYAMHGSGSGLQVVNSGSKNAAPVVDRSSLASIAAAIQPDVVVIQTSDGEGSGVVISADGYIVTNNHVVETATNSTVKVTFNSGKVVNGTVVGTDPKTDLAVVKVSGVSDLSFAAWGNSDDVQVGDTVLAVGSPLGLQGSVTAGIISALHRTISVGGDQQSRFSAPTPTTTIGDALQTDAPINPGNSGGALVDTNGKVIGINSAIATSGSSGNIGVGFAIPANKAKSVAQALINGGKVSHPFLGVSVVDGQNGGAQVQAVQSGGPADKAGLKVGDVVTKVGSRAISSGDDLVGAIQSSAVGSTLTLTIERGGATQTVNVTVGESN
jgi:putative serine protease PepD